MKWKAAVMIGLCMMVCLPGAVGGGEAFPDAVELLDRFAESQRVFDSFTAKMEVAFQISTKSLNPQGSNYNQEVYHLVDFRYDRKSGRRNMRTWMHGEVLPILPRVSPDDPMYKSRLLIPGAFDLGYSRTNMSTDPGRVSLTSGVDPWLLCNHALARQKQQAVFGYLYGNDKRVDELLLEAGDLRVRPRMQAVGGSDCYVIEATSEAGQHVLWIDPEHGYHLARAVCLVTEGNTLYETTAGEGERYLNSLDRVRFERVEGVWVPVEARIVYSWVRPGRERCREEVQFKAIEYRFHPDHDALGSFGSEDVQNGAIVTLVDEAGQVHCGKHVWLDGQAVEKEAAGLK